MARSASAGASARRSGAKRSEEVLAAALDVFHLNGYAAASIQDVADRLGILKGSVYHYISGKEELLFRVMESTHLDVERLLDEVAQLEGLTPIERLERYVANQVVYALDNIKAIRIYHTEVNSLSKEHRELVVSWHRVHERFVRDLIAQAQSDGSVMTSHPPPLLATLLFGTIISLHRWYRPGTRTSRRNITSATTDFILDGIGRRPQ